MNSFADVLITFRAAHGLSQPALADILGVCARTVWAWEDGKKPTDLNRRGVEAQLAEYTRKNGKKKRPAERKAA